MKTLDQKNWKRAKHFQFFNALDYPHFNLCAKVDITALHTFAKSEGYSLFKSILYIAVRAANDIPAFRLRIRGEEVVEHERVHPSYTSMTDQEVFSFTDVKFHIDPSKFFENCRLAEMLVKSEASVESDPNRDARLFITSIPWIHFTSFVHPIDIKAVDSVPRISWGKYQWYGEKLMLPLSMQAHHALADGWHTGQFFQLVEKYLEKPGEVFEDVRGGGEIGE